MLPQVPQGRMILAERHVPGSFGVAASSRRQTGELARRYGWIISTYVLMTNHFHLVIETPEPNLAAGMKWLNSSYACWYNRRHRKTGHLFGERYKAIHVQTEEYMQRLARYVVLNPVRAKMVATPGEYRWSSYRATAGLDDCPDWLKVGGLETYFGDASSWRENYVSYVAEGIDTADPIWRGLRRRVFLGTEAWLRSMRQKIDVAWRHIDIPHDQRAAGRPSMGAIVNAVADAMKLRPREIRRGSGGLARKVAAWLGVYEGRRRLRVIAKTLHLKSCSRITQLAAECDRLLRGDKRLATVVSALRLGLAHRVMLAYGDFRRLIAPGVLGLGRNFTLLIAELKLRPPSASKRILSPRGWCFAKLWFPPGDPGGPAAYYPAASWKRTVCPIAR